MTKKKDLGNYADLPQKTKDAIKSGKKKPNANGLIPLGGKDRQYLDPKTNKIISRRQYDKKYGALKKGALTSYEKKAKKAKAEIPELAAARPARGRRSALRHAKLGKNKNRASGIDASRISKGKGKGFHRKYEIPYRREAVMDFIPRAKRNRNIRTIGISNLVFYFADGSRTFSSGILPTIARDDFPGPLQTWEIVEAAEEEAHAGTGSGTLQGETPAAITINMAVVFNA